jgi:calcineurin-like phosphoesterase family protein
MTAFFTSDHHFGDHRVLNRYPRPFGSVAEMDEGLIARWNAVVGPDDEVWHLGDFARTAKRAAEILPHLNGRKHLIVGNNDPDPEIGAGWASVAPYAEIRADGVHLVLCHYPFRTWNQMYKGSLNLHGHSHGRLKPLPRQFDVGVDARDFRPVTVAELLASVKKRPAKAQKSEERLDLSAAKLAGL